MSVSADAIADRKLSTFAGVFTPTVLTILGTIMYLRTGFVVGNAGMVGAIVIILAAHVITITTGLAVSSVATNTRVGAGGAFAIISKSLGLEVGGAVGIPLFFAQGISVGLYVLGFSEAWQRLPVTIQVPGIGALLFGDLPLVVVAYGSFLIVFAIAYISTEFAARTQYLILGIVGFSLFSVLLGAFPIAGRDGFQYAPQVWGEFTVGSFWETFAIFFPAVTGIMTGISLSGTLKDPRRSIPVGTLSGIGITLVIYLVLVYWLARIATPDELIENSTIMIDKAFWGWAILAGMLGATFSSALGSMVAAPRVMQALAANRILPLSELLEKESAGGEPRRAMLVTTAIAFLGLTFGIIGGGLNAIAGVITMFFLITYGSLNVVVLIEQLLDNVSFRPTLKIPRFVSFLGAASCAFVMFLVNPTFSLVAIVVVLGIYGFLQTRNLRSPQGDVRSGLFMTLAEWAVMRAESIPSAPERTWKPSMLVPVQSSSELAGSFRFLRSLTMPQGVVRVLAIDSKDSNLELEQLRLLSQAFTDQGIFSQITVLEEDDPIEAVRSATQVMRREFLRPNILFLQLFDDSDVGRLEQLINKTAAYTIGIVLLARHPVIGMGREKLINIWLADQGPDWNLDLRAGNHDLAMLSAYQLARNWDAQISLCMAVNQPESVGRAEDFLSQLIQLVRLPKNTKVRVFTDSFLDSLRLAPRADLSIFGLSRTPDLELSRRIIEGLDGSCIFVRDSGEESALA